MKTFFVMIIMAMITSLFSCCSDSRAKSPQHVSLISKHESSYNGQAVMDEFLQLLQDHYFGVEKLKQITRFVKPLSPDSAQSAVLEQISQVVKGDLKDGHTRVVVNNVQIRQKPELSPAQLRSTKMLLNTHRYIHYLNTPQESDFLRYGLLKSDQHIGYIKLVDSDSVRTRQAETDSFKQSIDTALNKLRNTKGVILDIRSTQGDKPQALPYLVGRFLTAPSAKPLRQSHHFDDKHLFKRVVPTGDYQYMSPVIVLTDRKTSSYAEYIALALATQEHVYSIGNRTAGKLADMDSIRLNLDSEIVVHLPVRQVKVLSQGRFLALEGKGVTPDRILSPSVSQVIQGLDIHLTDAARHVQSQTGG